MLQHAAQGSHTGPGTDEDRITPRVLQYEIAVRSVKLNRCAFWQVTQIVREKSILYSIEADVEQTVSCRRRGDRVGTSDLASVVLGLHGDELSGRKIERGDFL